MPNISSLQILWLFSRGGRTAEDVVYDDKGLFTFMLGEDGYKRVYLPDDDQIKMAYSIEKRRGSVNDNNLVLHMKARDFYCDY